jgi:hypothetical protein
MVNELQTPRHACRAGFGVSLSRGKNGVVVNFCAIQNCFSRWSL